MKLQSKLFLSMVGFAAVPVMIVLVVVLWQTDRSTQSIGEARAGFDATYDDESVAPVKRADALTRAQAEKMATDITGAGGNPSRSLAAWCGTVGIGALLAAIVVAGLLARRIAVPIARANHAAEQIALGDYRQRLKLDRKDEIGQLADALDRISEELTDATELVTEIAGGNLGVNVKLASEKDQLGRALQTMVTDLNIVLTSVQHAVSTVASGAQQIADSTQSLSHGGTEQASSLEQITAAMTQMAGQTKQNAENAGLANQHASEARGSSEQGNSQMTQMVESMGAMNEASVRISKIIKVIDEIAFQTNLLALNAAVEAARAGKHGKGFAVVAEEVRNLAARSAKAAHETTALIEESVERVRAGTGIAQGTAEALNEIFANVTKTTDLVGEIAAASNEQAQGLAQVNQGLCRLEQVTQQNAANAEQGASAAEELAGQANHLRQLVARFKLRDDAHPPRAGLRVTQAAQQQTGPPSDHTREGLTAETPCSNVSNYSTEQRDPGPAPAHDGAQRWAAPGTTHGSETQRGYAQESTDYRESDVEQMRPPVPPGSPPRARPTSAAPARSPERQRAGRDEARPRIALDDAEFEKF